MIAIQVPASTSNLGPGFDALGLALNLHLTVGFEPPPDHWGSFLFQGEGADSLRDASEDNLIFRTMRFAAEREGVDLRPVRVYVKNEIPLARGLGSSGAAIIAGLSLFEAITDSSLGPDKLLSYATEIEGHGDNVTAALLGSFVVSCVSNDGTVMCERLSWPEELRAIAVIPDFKVRTEEARAVVPDLIPRKDAVSNIQRSSLMVAAVAGRRFDVMREAMRDCLHQPYRAPLVPGLAEVLELADGRLADTPGFVGLALSGSGPTVLALATG
ncbi:MAG TPA: homoserine kinase, partial [Blastocatellia bacterium]|nr:homoserine kinase [Blastocatellia bacterium]